MLRYISFFFFGLLIISCNDENASSKEIVWSGEVLIQDTFTLKEGHSITIMPGAEVSFSPGALVVAFGDIIAEGTEAEPITLKAIDPIGDHRIIQTKSQCKRLHLKHVNIINGLITSYMTDNHFDHCTFSNSKKLKWNDAMARFWWGKILIENCTANWNNQGEGILVHKTDKPIIRNCNFDQLPDAIEFIHLKNGEITNCNFSNNGDDAIDFNDCQNSKIENCTFLNVKDRALELGSEKFGSSHDLEINNNLFVECKVAINVKESSNAHISNATFFNNGISLDVHTPADSTISSKATLVRSIISGGNLQVSANSRAIADLDMCLADQDLDDVNTNVVGAIEFKDSNNLDFTLISDVLPEGMTKETLGYQAKK